MNTIRISVLLALCLSLGCGAAFGQAATGSGESELEQIIERQNELIRNLTERIGELEARVGVLEGEETPEEIEILSAVAAPAPAEALELSEEERREQERLVRAAFQQTLIERGGLLLPKGAVDIEPSMSYLQSSSENIVIDGFTLFPVLVVGDIVSERVQHEVLQTAATVRAGLPWNSQIEIRVPYGYQQQRRFSADNDERRISSSHAGDITLGFSRQVTQDNALWPDLLANLSYKTRTGTSPFDIDSDSAIATGTGYDSLSLGLTGVKVLDPVVYFGSLSYGRNFAASEAIGRYDPGDSFGFSLGMAIALNLNSSLSFAYDQQRIKRAHVNRVGVPGSYSTTGIFSIGATFAVGDGFTTDLSLGIGTTEDSPDVSLQASFPIRLRR